MTVTVYYMRKPWTAYSHPGEGCAPSAPCGYFMRVPRLDGTHELVEVVSPPVGAEIVRCDVQEEGHDI